MFMSDKPHRYGSKMFMTCDSRTAYCHRFEMYVGNEEMMMEVTLYLTTRRVLLRSSET
ncbi:hypothetical protein PC110_g17566 [Phytophthora cactorum]|uniref:PiggyBac transposable element-derived protein domain-containing protein n=1 Tax=Phytophthora cactorum TaxID=29920 RepID=A0A329RNW6_9STRA|nr:hypothetical protein PC110_g17566 [Phytophthora cactorum]